MNLQDYLEQLGDIPTFIYKYLKAPSLKRLKNVGYFCGMDYASKNIYQFSEYISRYDHSITVALLVYNLTGNIKASVAGLLHDISTPCFSHVIDYMNKDYEKQESTEEYTEYIIRHDKYLLMCLEEDNINIEDVIDFKQYSIVDNDRPKMCADRLDGIILNGMGWTKNISYEDVNNILSSLCIYINEYNEYEMGFKSYDVALRVLEISECIDRYCHTKEDNYMMDLLADITKLAIDKKYISYEDLYRFNEKELFLILKHQKDIKLKELIYKFKNISYEEIPNFDIPNVKKRSLNPLVNRKRLK